MTSTFFYTNPILRTIDQRMEPSLHLHLKNVYACAALSKFAGSVGSFIHLYTGILSGGLFSLFFGLCFLITFKNTLDDGKSTKTRSLYLLVSAFLCGLGIGSPVESAIAMEPTLIFTGFLASFVIFFSFTLASLMSNQCQHICLGGILMSFLSTMMMFVGYRNSFLKSYLIYETQIYIGSAVTCACILYDTQKIMEKRRNGDKDFIRNATKRRNSRLKKLLCRSDVCWKCFILFSLNFFWPDSC